MLYEKECKMFFGNLDPSKKCGSSFWKTIQHFFSEKPKTTNKITLVDEDETVISDDQLMSEEFSQSFQNATNSLNIRENSYLTDENDLSSQNITIILVPC